MTLLAPEKIDLQTLPLLALAQRSSLPNIPAIYFVLGAENEVLYIGRAKSLCLRWHAHHRFQQFSKLGIVHIAWLTVTDNRLLPSIEQALIDYFDPCFNHDLVPDKKWRQTTVRLPSELFCKVKYYLTLEGKSFNQFCTEKIEAYVAEREKAQPRCPRAAPSA